MEDTEAGGEAIVMDELLLFGYVALVFLFWMLITHFLLIRLDSLYFTLQRKQFTLGTLSGY